MATRPFDDPSGQAARGRPVFALGFRPFYLAASGFAVLAVPLWVAQYHGLFFVDGSLSGAAWHAHEMVFGFAAAVLAGFLLTAVRQWTGLPTPTGPVLAAMVGLWAAGRVLVVVGPSGLAAVVDVAFLPAVALAIALPILRSGNRRNLFVVALVGVLAAANLVFHLDHLGVVRAGAGGQAIRLAFDVLAILMAVIAGRVVPMFTRNGVPAARPRRMLPIEIAALGTLFAILVIDAIDMAGVLWAGSAVSVAVLAGIGAVAHAARLWLWDPLATRREPLLWSLPLAYAWLPVALALRAGAAATDAVAPALGDHALGIGAMGGLMLAMMTRSALGHTGRALKAGPAETAGYLMIACAALLRVAGSLVVPAHWTAALVASSVCWSAAFLVFFIRYWPILTRPRPDRRSG